MAPAARPRPTCERSRRRFFNRQLGSVAVGSRFVLPGRAIQFQDPASVNLSHTALDWRIVGLVSAVLLILAIAQLALDLNVGTFLQLASELGEFAQAVQRCHSVRESYPPLLFFQTT